MVLWSRAAVQIWSAHENGPEGAPGMDTEIPEEGACRCSCGSCAFIEISVPFDLDMNNNNERNESRLRSALAFLHGVLSGDHVR